MLKFLGGMAPVPTLATPKGFWEHAPQFHLRRWDFPCSFDAHVHNTQFHPWVATLNTSSLARYLPWNGRPFGHAL